MIRATAKLLSVLNSETDPGQISLAVAFSMIAGLTPFWSLHNLLVLFLILVIRVNLSAFMLGWAFFSGVAYLIDPLFHRIGLALLTAPALEGSWTALYNTPLGRLSRFNNTIVMGSLAFSLLFFVPLLLVSNRAIRKYREHLLAWVQQTRLMQAFTGTRVYQLYRTYSDLRGIV
jgi:uncharacterized protein (TIGR03546 family)